MITLRPVTHNDLPLFAGSSYAAMPPEAIRQMLRESAVKDHGGKFFQLVAVMDDNCCVGFVSLFALGDGEISCGPEIKPQYRKQGFASQAVTQAMAYAKTLGFTKAVAQVRTDNAPSIALHKKLGFSQEREFVNAKGNSVLWFEKALCAPHLHS